MRLSRVIATCALALLLPATSSATSPAAASPAGAAVDGAAARPAALTVVGNGFGHGHGLSQWGAYYQAEQGRTHRQILDFYYPRLQQGRAGGSVSVLISGDTTADVVVLARPGLRASAADGSRGFALTKAGARQYRIVAADGGRRSAVSWRGQRGGWKALRTVPGFAQFDAGGAPITLVTPTERRAYRGVLRSAAPAAKPAARDTVNVVTLETYLRGVVPREVPALWPAEAVRAQAVAARTYAAYERAHPLAGHYQICDTTQCQVYGGATDEHPGSDAALKATARQVLTHDGAAAFTQFSASNGGYQAPGPVDYLGTRRDPYDVAYRGWRATVTAAQLEAALPGNGAFRSAEVTRRDGRGAFGGRVADIRLTFAQRSVTITGDQFRSFFGLRSELFELR